MGFVMLTQDSGAEAVVVPVRDSPRYTATGSLNNPGGPYPITSSDLPIAVVESDLWSEFTQRLRLILLGCPHNVLV